MEFAIARQEENKTLRCNDFLRLLRRLICPSGSAREFLSSPFAKNKSLLFFGNV